MASYPTLSGGRTFMAPMTDTVCYPVRVLKFASEKQQRFRTAPKLRKFTLTHTGITKTDVASLQSFAAGLKGTYDEFDITVDGTLYSHLVLESEQVQAIESAPLQYTATLQMRQTQ